MPSVAKLLARPLAELRERFLEKRAPVPAGVLEELETDPRQGARELARLIRGRRQRNRVEGQRLRDLLRYESELWEQGLELVAGVDEAGVGPLAGPLVAGAVILPKGYKLHGLDDSKKVLDPEKREELAQAVRAEALAWSTGWAEVEEVDRLNIYHAALLAMSRAVRNLSLEPQFCLVDARRIPDCQIPQRGIVHGDALSASIAAGSIIAKTTRDQHMREMDRQHPGYGFASHKGYPTPEHKAVLRKLGASPIHRRSFAAVREVLGLKPLQTELFPSPGGPA